MADELVNNCIVGHTSSGWCWVCVKCGEGGLAGSEIRAARANEVVKKASKHKCLPAAIPMDLRVNADFL